MPDGKVVSYPIENHFYQFDKDTVALIIKDLVEMAKEKEIVPANFEEFLKGRFGKTLYNLYFHPYNYKVWRRDLSSVPLSWLEGKLPMPTVEEIVYNNIYHVKEDSFVHSSFYYPLEDGSQFLADTLAMKVFVRYDSPVRNLKIVSQNGGGIFGRSTESSSMRLCSVEISNNCLRYFVAA